MKGSPEVVKVLQAALAAESHLNLQYRLDRESLKHAGIKRAGAKVKKFAHEAHGFRSAVNKQLLFLAGDQAGAATYSVAPVIEQATVAALFDNELKLNMTICATYEQNIQVAVQALDDETRNLFEHLIKWHHDHVRWIEQQIRLIGSLGEGSYITTQV